MNIISAEHLETAIHTNFTSDQQYEILRAYDLLSNSDDIKNKIETLYTLKYTFKNCINVILSTRFPYTIMVLASEIGMYIPISKRYGLNAYEFYIQNVKYYEKVAERIKFNLPAPKFEEIYYSENRYELLSTYRDDEFLKPPYTFPTNYSIRENALRYFLKMNMDTIGNFNLPNNSRSIYDSQRFTIYYECYIAATNQIVHFEYNSSDFLKLIDMEKQCVYTNNEKTCIFSPLSLLNLRKKIITKFDKWKARDNSENVGSVRLHKIAEKLYKLFEHTKYSELLIL